MLFRTLDELEDALRPALARDRQEVREIVDADMLRDRLVDRLVYNAVFHSDVEIKSHARFVIKSAAARLGVFPASIQALYAEKGHGRHLEFTVPAINLRAMTYDGARAVFEAAQARQAGAFLFEIARSEIAYSDQWPSEYAAVVLGAAIKTGFSGPLFLLGDHFQVRAASFFGDPELEMEAIRILIRHSLKSGFFNIDIDASTLVDLRKENLAEQQRLNCDLTATFTQFIRQQQPVGVTVAVGGEIGEVGGKNSTVEELHAFMEGYRLSLEKLARDVPGLCKISVQTGTTHGGVPLPDGSIARVNLDFPTLSKLSVVARKLYGLAGAVQHGASTLPLDLFHRFPEATAAEIHLATGFQNLLLDHPRFPADLRVEIYDYLREKCARWRREGQSDEQFLYKNRKRALKPFKRTLWDLPGEIREVFRTDMRSVVGTMFDQLGVAGTRSIVETCIQPIEYRATLDQERELIR
jgi:fructose/tagatose bisphosphate aldolase